MTDLCKTCKHEGTNQHPFCMAGTASICHKYEIHATKEEVKTLTSENAVQKKEIERLEKSNAALHRRAQKAEGIIAQSGIVEGREQGSRNRSLGRALANYAATTATTRAETAEAKTKTLEHALATIREMKDVYKAALANAEAKMGEARETEANLRKVIDTIAETECTHAYHLRQALKQPGNDLSGLKKWALENCICADIDSGTSEAHTCPGCNVLLAADLWESPSRCSNSDTHCPRCGIKYQPKWNGQCANCTAIETPRALLTPAPAKED